MEIGWTAQQPIRAEIKNVKHRILCHFGQDLFKSKEIINKMVVSGVKVRLRIINRCRCQMWFLQRALLWQFMQSPRRNHMQHVVEVDEIDANVCFEKQLQTTVTVE